MSRYSKKRYSARGILIWENPLMLVVWFFLWKPFVASQFTISAGWNFIVTNGQTGWPNFHIFFLLLLEVCCECGHCYGKLTFIKLRMLGDGPLLFGLSIVGWNLRMAFVDVITSIASSYYFVNVYICTGLSLDDSNLSWNIICFKTEEKICEMKKRKVKENRVRDR